MLVPVLVLDAPLAAVVDLEKARLVQPLQPRRARVRIIINKGDARKDRVHAAPHLALRRTEAVNGALPVAVGYCGVFSV